MFRLRRVCKPINRSDTWKVAGLLKKICSAYEENGRNPATIYIQGFSTPGEEILVYAEWDQDSIEYNPRAKVPEIIMKEYAKELSSLILSNKIEFYEIATIEKLKQWGET